MSFQDDFTLQLRADLAQALALPAAAVYVGRQAQKVTRTGLEVWVRPRAAEQPARASGDPVKVHPFEVHVRLKTRREENQTGGNQLEEVQATLDVLCERYDGARPFVQALPDLVALSVEDVNLDEDPEEPDLLDGVLILRALER